jgi:hypothetical protein
MLSGAKLLLTGEIVEYVVVSTLICAVIIFQPRAGFRVEIWLNLLQLVVNSKDLQQDISNFSEWNWDLPLTIFKEKNGNFI